MAAPARARGSTPRAARYDLIVRGGSVADGLGGPLFEADVAIDGGRIMAVGKLSASGSEEIDARGCLVTPGFVDIHTHYDGQAIWDSRLASSSLHGVTTVVTGNCGVGFAPVREENRQRLIELMEGIEDIPGIALHEGLDWGWESFGEFLAAAERLPHDVDIGVQLAHAPLRLHVMGERAMRLEPATEADILRMRELAREAACAGAIGFSTSRTMNHKTLKGDPTPSLRAAEDELLGIAMGLAEAGRGVLQLASDFDTPSMEEEFAMLRRIVARSGRPMSYTVFQKHHDPEGWRQLLALTADAAAEGLPMRGQVAPRPIGVLHGFEASINAFSHCPSYVELAEQPFEERLARLRQPETKARLLGEIATSKRLVRFSLLFPLSDPPDYAPAKEDSVAALAARSGRSAPELAYELMLAKGGRALLYAPFANYADFTLEACGEMIADPNTLIGLGDGGAHVGVIADASLPTFMLTYWRGQGPRRFELPWLVRRLSSETARAVGLHDRGVIAPGMKADVNVIDTSRLGIASPEIRFDLPAGGKRFVQAARGYLATIVSGVTTYRDGTATGPLPGRLVSARQAGA